MWTCRSHFMPSYNKRVLQFRSVWINNIKHFALLLFKSPAPDCVENVESAGPACDPELRRSNRLARKPPALGPAPPLRIVSIGGGTGLSTLLRGLKRYVKAAEGSSRRAHSDRHGNRRRGGSSGRLRREFDVLPPGDIRSCMVALAEHEGS